MRTDVKIGIAVGVLFILVVGGWIAITHMGPGEQVARTTPSEEPANVVDTPVVPGTSPTPTPTPAPTPAPVPGPALPPPPATVPTPPMPPTPSPLPTPAPAPVPTPSPVPPTTGPITPAPSPSPTDSTTYVVAKNDTFYSIAAKVYGNGKYHTLIQRANHDVNPNALQAGMKLVIPPKPQDTTPTAATGPAMPLEKDVYVVQSGDTLWKLAQKYYGNGALAGRIKEANNLTSDSLKVGQRLKIPAKPDTAGGSTTQAAGASGGQYVVVAGDTLLKVAGKVYGDNKYWPVLREANKSNAGVAANRLKPGDKLTIPPLDAVVTTGTPTSGPAVRVVSTATPTSGPARVVRLHPAPTPTPIVSKGDELHPEMDLR